LKAPDLLLELLRNGTQLWVSGLGQSEKERKQFLAER